MRRSLGSESLIWSQPADVRGVAVDLAINDQTVHGSRNRHEGIENPGSPTRSALSSRRRGGASEAGTELASIASPRSC